MPETKIYFLLSRYGGVGSTCMFHNKDERGYGSDLRNLETYTKEQAQLYHDQYGRDSLPLLVNKVVGKTTSRVDMQYIDAAKGLPTTPITPSVCVLPGQYNGNDILFKTVDGVTYNLEHALVKPRCMWEGIGDRNSLWALEYLIEKSRPTFQKTSINTRSMCRGVKLQRIKKPTSDKHRWNCPSCGKIHWQYNPYDFEGCNDVMCDEWKY